MSSPRSTSMEAQESTRKRVCKACDRCRLKKSKCDGASPCSRCKADNSICVFGKRKKSQDKFYPKGYVEMLEQQRLQLVAGLRELYSRLQTGQGWPGAPLRNAQSGHPLTHDILERLDLLHSTSESNSNYEGFEEDCSRMQRKLLERGALYTHRRGSLSSNSDHNHTSSSASSFTRYITPPTMPIQSPFPRQLQLAPSIKQENITSAAFMTSGALDTLALNQSAWEPVMMDEPLDFSKPMYPFKLYNSFDSNSMVLDTCVIPGDLIMSGWNELSDLDFSSFIQNPMNA